MARLARVVLPSHPHHIIQRGNRRQDVFFVEEDYMAYLSLLKEWCAREDVEIWAYCLMTNHVHLVVCPTEGSNMSRAIGETHRRYTRMINFREGWRGYLWQGRFASYPMDEAWLLRAVAYVELNPVKAGMVKHAWEYPWSSVHAHLSGHDENGIVRTKPLLSLIGNWRSYLEESMLQTNEDIACHERTGRPLGSEAFVDMAGRILGRDLRKQKPGPKHRDK
jgi:putative transposase